MTVGTLVLHLSLFGVLMPKGEKLHFRHGCCMGSHKLVLILILLLLANFDFEFPLFMCETMWLCSGYIMDPSYETMWFISLDPSCDDMHYLLSIYFSSHAIMQRYDFKC